MKFSFSTLGCPDYSFEEMIKIAKENGYEGIELRIYKGSADYHLDEAFQPGNIGKLRQLFNSSGIAISCCSSSVRFSLPGRAEQQKQIELADTYFNIASELDCKYIRIFGGPYPINFTGRKTEKWIDEYREGLTPEQVEGLTKEECDKWITEGLGKVAELGKTYGVMPLLETHDDFSDGKIVRQFIDNSGSENIGILWDCLHPYRYGLDLRETYSYIKGRVHHVHMKDSSDLSPFGFTPTLVGDGEMDIATALDILKEDHFSDYISFEWEKLWHMDIEPPEVAFPQFIQSVRQMI